jgi:3-mercaptopyruvate sulfurtransferase SseA
MQLQFIRTIKYDNNLYHTVYIEDLPDALKTNPGHLLLDVRSPGEYHDTSMYDISNIGRLKGSKNITIVNWING